MTMKPDGSMQTPISYATLLQMLSRETGLLASDIRRIISSAEISYKTYTIPKRSGGQRVISQPSRPVKLLQRAVSNNILSNLPIHNAATAYRQHQSIMDNATPHMGVGRPILKMDFKNFFTSIKSLDWEKYCVEKNICDDESIFYLKKLLFKKEYNMRGLRLAIGAPSSPILSNVIMFYFDEMVYNTIASENVVYTRYADDLTFSAPKTGYLVNVEKKLRKIIKEIPFPRLEINHNKTVYATSKYKRSVTGLILTNDGGVSIGRDKKRLISASVHQANTGNIDAENLKKLSGYLAYVQSVEPTFLDFLRKKYGADIIDFLQKLGKPSMKSG